MTLFYPLETISRDFDYLVLIYLAEKEIPPILLMSLMKID